jgi:hypothetical protein
MLAREWIYQRMYITDSGFRETREPSTWVGTRLEFLEQLNRWNRAFPGTWVYWE